MTQSTDSSFGSAEGQSVPNKSANTEPERPAMSFSGHLPDSLIGRKIGHFFIEARLGTGAMASVYRATDQILNRPVALKILLPGADSVLRERFRQEARTVSGLDHPHIVRTLQVGQTDADGITYIAMELVEGISLGELLDLYRQLSPEDSCRILEPVSRALAYAHSQHVIHRDVKPSNILLRRVAPGTPNSLQIALLDYPVVPLLTDFGIALAADSPELTAAGRTIGTPTYMAPEQCSGSRAIDGRADIYALGTVLFRCLVGRPPFIGSTTQVLHAHVYEALAIPEQSMRALPPLVVEILQRTLAKDPDDRYSDASVLADGLARTAGIVAKGWRVEEMTATMEGLPSAKLADPVESARILVPAPGAKTSTTRSGQHSPSMQSPPDDFALMTGAEPAPSWLSKVWSNVAGVVIGLLLTLLLIAFGVVFMVTGLPFDSFWRPAATATTSIALVDTPVAVTQATAVPTLEAATSISTTAPTASEPTNTAPADTTPLAATPTEGPSAVTPTALSNIAVISETPTILPGVPVTLTPTLTVSQALTNITPIATTSPLTPTASLTATSTISSQSAVAFNVESVWDDAQFFYEDRDWNQTRDNVILLLRTDEKFDQALAQRENLPADQKSQATLIKEIFLQNANIPFWQKWRSLFSAQQVEQMLFDAYVGLGSAANASDAPKTALEFFNQALVLRPTDSKIGTLVSATTNYAASEEAGKAEARTALGTAHRIFADELAAAQKFCAAYEQLQAAANLLGKENFTEQVNVAHAECEKERNEVAGHRLLERLKGSIIYSTQVGKNYQIYRLPLVVNAKSKLLLDNASQPSLSPTGKLLAFYSRRTDLQGLSSVDLTKLQNADERPQRLSGSSEDSRDSPPSWSPSGDRLAFASMRNGLSEIHIKSVTGDDNEQQLAVGEDPAWRPLTSDERNGVAFSGRVKDSEKLGIWVMHENGLAWYLLTWIEGDRRPAWSPDGMTMVFMSQQRDQNWEIYRLAMAGDHLVRLTNDPAQDGLPTISPDGKYVAFASDRGGSWRIWVMPLDGSSAALPIGNIEGQLTNWLEHAIQWVN
jgi:serine/threonine-protein kinase